MAIVYEKVGNQASHRKYATGKRHNQKSLMHKICTWNVHGLNKPGKLMIVEKAVEDFAITGISESHWRYSAHNASQNGNLK